MSVIGSNILAGASGQGGEYTIEESLRFNASQSSYLSWTPASAGNRKTWTWSGWVKRGKLGATQQLFAVDSGGSISYLSFPSTDAIQFQFISGNYTTTTAVFRDPSSWYHIVFIFNSTEVNASDRWKIYVNGVKQTQTDVGSIGLDNNGPVNTTSAHYLTSYLGASNYFDGYLTELNFIDGQALDPSSFGETDAITGVWKPKQYTGTYGTNGFYLPMKLDNTVEGFNTVTWRGTGSTQQISGVGFSPDLVWIKNRSVTSNHDLIDSVRGATKVIESDLTSAEFTEAENLKSFNADGFTVGSVARVNGNGHNLVAWCWDAGSSTVSNTDGSITSSVRANPTYGFSVVTYTGNGGTNQSVGHGLGLTPKFLILKNRDTANDWYAYTTEIDGSLDYGRLNTTAAFTSSSASAPTSSVFYATGAVVNASGDNVVAYCFAEVNGYSKFGSYTGTGASGNTVTTGFKPAMVMIKRTDTTSNWVIMDNTRRSVNPNGLQLYPNLPAAEDDYTTVLPTDLTDTGFTLNHNTGNTNASGGTYIYMAFKDTREYAFWLDDSGNNNDWQPNGGITTSSTVTDTPTPYLGGGNYAVMNPVAPSLGTRTLTNGNLNIYLTGASQARSVGTCVTPSSGKYYFEITANDANSNMGIGIFQSTARVDAATTTAAAVYFQNGEYKIESNAQTSGFSTYTNGDVIGVGISMDVNPPQIYFAKNNTWQNSANPSSGTGGLNLTAGMTYLPMFDHRSSASSSSGTANFGQRPFVGTVPTGFKALHTGNLPDSTIVDGSKHFDVVTRTGTGAENTITGLGFRPDLLWTKTRSNAVNHSLTSTGLTYNYSFLQTNTTEPENTSASQYYMIPTSDGYTIGTGDNINQNTYTFVDWLWKANGTGVSNTDGSITSTVSANPTAGFSVVTFTGNGVANATVGHGLGANLAMVIQKSRSDSATGWIVWHKDLPNAYSSTTGYISLHNTNAASTTTVYFNGSLFSDAVFALQGTNTTTNNNGSTYVAYCFANVEGFSKMGSYVGNGSADGTFVYLGFNPKYVLTKRADSTGEWWITDATRYPENIGSVPSLWCQSSGAEASSTAYNVDLLSNGFKLRTTYADKNTSGGTFIYIAFAENPFKNSLAQ